MCCFITSFNAHLNVLLKSHFHEELLNVLHSIQTKPHFEWNDPFKGQFLLHTERHLLLRGQNFNSALLLSNVSFFYEYDQFLNKT